MSEARPHPPDTDSPKHQAVLHAAEELFMAHGYEAVSMDVIAREAGVSKATLYAHFVSKEQLFATIIIEACRTRFDWSSLLEPGEAGIRANLLTFGGRFLRFILDDGPLAVHRIVIAEGGRFPALCRAYWDGGPQVLWEFLRAWLGEQERLGRLRVPDSAVAADHLVSLLRGRLHPRVALRVPPHPTEAEIDATVKAAVDVFLAAYGVAGA